MMSTHACIISYYWNLVVFWKGRRHYFEKGWLDTKRKKQKCKNVSVLGVSGDEVRWDTGHSWEILLASWVHFNWCNISCARFHLDSHLRNEIFMHLIFFFKILRQLWFSQSYQLLKHQLFLVSQRLPKSHLDWTSIYQFLISSWSLTINSQQSHLCVTWSWGNVWLAFSDRLGKSRK